MALASQSMAITVPVSQALGRGSFPLSAQMICILTMVGVRL